MKKMYTMALLLALIGTNIYAQGGGRPPDYKVYQRSWRWRNKDGNEATATWKANQNTTVTFNGSGVIRLRIEIENYSTWSVCSTLPCTPTPLDVTLNDTLQYSTTPADGTSWVNITFDASKAFVIGGAANRLKQNPSTTAELTGSSATFSPGKVLVTDTVIRNLSIDYAYRAEIEVSLKATKQLLPETVYYFRVKNRSPAAVITYPVGYPSLSTSPKTSVNALQADKSVAALMAPVAGKTGLSVVPNPANSAIGFRLGSGSTKVEATLYDITGRIIYRQAFATIQPNTLYRLSMAQPPVAGTYILKVTGNGLSESSRVVVQ